MKRFCLLLSLWIGGLVIAGLSVSSQLTEADPVDDFRMNLGKPSQRAAASGQDTSNYRLISEETVVRILNDRMIRFSRADAPKLAKHLMDLCKAHRFDPAFVLSLIDVESHFHPEIVSPAGAIGLMQIMAPTAHFVLTKLAGGSEIPMAELPEGQRKSLRPENLRVGKLGQLLKEPFVNLAIGIAYLGWLRDYYQGMPPYYVLAAYNVGPAKLDQLLSRKSFKPNETKKYYVSILKRVHQFRFYQEKTPRTKAREV